MSDVGVLLVGPTGAAFLLQAWAGNGSISNVTYTLADGAATALPQFSAWANGTYTPTDYYSAPTFDAPAPSSYAYPGPTGSDTFASVFGGTDPNGTWSLYTRDFSNGDAGQFAGGWSLNITAVAPVPEPSTWAMIAVGGLQRSRRRR